MPSKTESAEPLMELMSTPQQSEVPRAPAIDKVKGPDIPSPKKITAPPTKPKGIVIGAPAAPAPFISVEEGESILGVANIIPRPLTCP